MAMSMNIYIDLTEPVKSCQRCKSVLDEAYMLKSCRCVICSDCNRTYPGQCHYRHHTPAQQVSLPVFGSACCMICLSDDDLNGLKPTLRLACGHTLCIICLIKHESMHTKGTAFCPYRCQPVDDCGKCDERDGIRCRVLLRVHDLGQIRND
ncbi:hypothetical protein BKA67DRAFT_533739 [Truncatella angustata]|uniref:RING-type domain-containing protein n=1 Tax=Truncatella angustata TaxID=152316 RepID=A0A9P8UUH6_9PEZI|nr:uncharacterized protein BKA67DRAFT_533739 [Truncatella angustata]KAH6658604.1 hypothetical protein BKA67DRAFT_533739 [Truncatella angustata]